MSELRNDNIIKGEESGDLMVRVSELTLIASYSIKKEAAVRKNLWLVKDELESLAKQFWENTSLENSVDTFLKELGGIWITIREQGRKATRLFVVDHSNAIEFLNKLFNRTDETVANLLYKYLSDAGTTLNWIIFHEVFPCEESKEQIHMRKFVLSEYKKEAVLTTRNNEYDDISFVNYWLEPDVNLIPAQEKANKILLERLHQNP